MKTTLYWSKPLLLGCTALGSFLIQPAVVLSQEGEQLEEIVVVGSRTKPRSVQDSPVPVDVFTASDLEQSGSFNGELSQLLHNMAPMRLRALSTLF